MFLRTRKNIAAVPCKKCVRKARRYARVVEVVSRMQTTAAKMAALPISNDFLDAT